MTLAPASLKPIRAGMRTEYWHDAGIRIIFDYLNPTSKGLEAWCEVRWQGNVPEPFALTFGRYDLMGATTVKRLADNAALDCPRLGSDTKAELRAMVREAVYDMIQHHLDGEETVVLADVEPSDSQWVLRPLLETGTNTRIIAKGGSTKSFFALVVAVTIATGRPKLLGLRPAITGPVLYLDWEADQRTHANRLRALCAGAGIEVPRNVIYEHHKDTLARMVHGIARSIAEHDPVALVIDSNAMARGGTGGGGAEDSTLQMFSALRQLERPALIVDHKSDEKIRKGEKGGYGSIYTQNLARLEWEYSRVQEVGNTKSFVISLEKANNIATGQELAYEFTFNNVGEGDDRHLESVDVRQISPSSVTSGGPWEQAESNRDRIRSLLAAEDGPLGVRDISDRLHIPEATVRTTLNRHEELFIDVDTTPKKWTLKERNDAKPIPF